MDIKWAPLVCARRTVDCCLGLQQLGGYVPLHPHNCPLTEREGILRRFTQVVPLPTELGIRTLESVAEVILADKKPGGFTLVPRNAPLGEVEHFLANKPAKAKRRYEEARARKVLHGLKNKNAHCTLFVKPDGVDPQAKTAPPPRVIIYRDPEFAVEFWRVVGPLEHRLYQIQGSPATLPNVGPVFGKGKTTHERAAMIVQNLEGFEDPAVLSMDASRFDRHISQAMHEAKFKIIAAMTNPAGRRFLSRWMEAYLHPTIRTMSGTRIRDAPCTLKSGDMDTALGNNICAWLIHVSFSLFLRGRHPDQRQLESVVGTFQYLRQHEYAVLVDGDDCQSIVERSSLRTVQRLCIPFFLQVGVQMKVESVACEWPAISWCQHNLQLVEPGRYQMVRNPRKVMSAAMSGVKWNVVESMVRQRLAAIGECELCLNSGIPVLQPFALMLLRWSAGALAADVSDEGVGVRYRLERKKGWTSVSRPIHPEARVWFSRAFPEWTLHRQSEVEYWMEHVQMPTSSHEAVFSQLSWCWETGSIPQFVALDDSL